MSVLLKLRIQIKRSFQENIEQNNIAYGFEFESEP